MMLQITPQMRLLVAVEPVDFRKGIDGLVHLCKQSLGEDPLRGAVFAFRNPSTIMPVLFGSLIMPVLFGSLCRCLPAGDRRCRSP
jgi:hypothetical protein